MKHRKSKLQNRCLIYGLVLILGATVISCAGVKYSWTRGDKVALGAMIVARGADVVTTINNLNEGHVETNWIYGEHPTNAMLIGSQILLTGIWAWAAQYVTSDIRKVVFGFPTVVHGIAAYNNYKEK